MKTPVLLVLFAFLALALTSVKANDAVEPPVPVRMVAPKYPVELRKDGLSGLVTVLCLVDEKGNVVETTVQKSTHAAFVDPALEALRKWKFKPGKKDGTATPMRVNIPVQFSVQED